MGRSGPARCSAWASRRSPRRCRVTLRASTTRSRARAFRRIPADFGYDAGLTTLPSTKSLSVRSRPEVLVCRCFAVREQSDRRPRSALAFARLRGLAAVLRGELRAAHHRLDGHGAVLIQRGGGSMIIDAYNTTQNVRGRSDYLTGARPGSAAAAARSVRPSPHPGSDGCGGRRHGHGLLAGAADRERLHHRSGEEASEASVRLRPGDAAGRRCAR